MLLGVHARAYNGGGVIGPSSRVGLEDRSSSARRTLVPAHLGNGEFNVRAAALVSRRIRNRRSGGKGVTHTYVSVANIIINIAFRIRNRRRCVNNACMQCTRTNAKVYYFYIFILTVVSFKIRYFRLAMAGKQIVYAAVRLTWIVPAGRRYNWIFNSPMTYLFCAWRQTCYHSPSLSSSLHLIRSKKTDLPSPTGIRLDDTHVYRLSRNTSILT